MSETKTISKEEIKELKKLYVTLKKENTTLKLQLVQQNKDHLQINKSLREQLNQKEKEVDTLKKNILNFETRYKKQINLLKKSQAKKLLEHEKRVKDYEKRMDVYNELQEKFNKILQEKILLQNSLDRMEKKSFEEKLKTEEEIASLKLKQSDIKNDFESKIKELIDGQEKNLHMAALQLVPQKTKDTLVENEILKEEFLDLQDKFKMVCDTKKKLIKENKELKRNKSMNEISLKQYAKHGFKLSSEIKYLKEKIKDSNESLRRLHQRKKEKVNDLRMENSDTHEKLMEVINQKNNLLRIRTTELVNLKKVSMRILNQRTELESFFMDALAYVKNQRKVVKLPNIKKKEKTIKSMKKLNESSFERKKKELIKIVEGKQNRFEVLPWDDKEKVLKLLFSKINGRKVSVLQRNEGVNGNEEIVSKRNGKGLIVNDHETG